jgi:hypothetical protein
LGRPIEVKKRNWVKMLAIEPSHDWKTPQLFARIAGRSELDAGQELVMARCAALRGRSPCCQPRDQLDLAEC